MRHDTHDLVIGRRHALPHKTLGQVCICRDEKDIVGHFRVHSLRSLQSERLMCAYQRTGGLPAIATSAFATPVSAASTSIWNVAQEQKPSFRMARTPCASDILSQPLRRQALSPARAVAAWRRP